MTYIILGPQGSGKGTQAKLLAKEFNLEHISIGDILRKEVASGSKLGKIIESYMCAGKLIPFDINNQLVKSAIEGRDNIIVDGYPRTREQAKFLFSNFKISGLIVIDISEAESINRISKRLICTANNKILIEGSISEDDIRECEALGGKIIKRGDDKPLAIRKRLEIYHKETEPLIDLFKENNIPIIRVNGEIPIDDLFSVLKEKFKKLFY
jgi:adenylate kinase